MNKTNKALTASLALGLGLTLSAAHASPSKITAQSIIVNPAPTELKVDVWTDKDATGNANPTYRIGDPISVGVKVNQDAYVYLFNVNADGAIDLFFPNGYEDSNFVKAGTARVFPRQGAKYALNIGGPAGQDKLLALASAKALSLDDIAKFAGDQGFAQVGIKGQQNLAKALSIIVNPLPANSWVTDVAFFRVNGTQASDPIKPAPNASIAPGERQDGSIDQAMADAYDRLKGQASLGDPTIYATRWADGWWQRFEGVGAYGDAVLLHANGSSRAYAVHGAIFKRYLDLARAENGVTRPPAASVGPPATKKSFPATPTVPAACTAFSRTARSTPPKSTAPSGSRARSLRPTRASAAAAPSSASRCVTSIRSTVPGPPTSRAAASAP